MLEHFEKAAKALDIDIDKIYEDMVKPLIKEEPNQRGKEENETGIKIISERDKVRQDKDIIENSYMGPFLKKWKKRMRNFKEKGIVYQSSR